jgi:hypothetical protein
MNAMNRREFLGSGLAVGICSTGSEMISPFVRAQSPKSDSIPLESTPAWLLDQPVVMAGCWDDFPLFQKRTGGAPTWMDELYREQRAERTVKKLKEAGVTLGMIHFFKGFGLEAEREHIADARALSNLLKENGIRVGIYVGSTIAYETFLLEKPDAEAWFVPDFMGRPVYYGNQPFRRRVYFMHPGYREYIKQVVRYGIENLNADLIHFDNTSQQAEPVIFQHPLAIEDFRKHLVSKYSATELKARFGFSDLRYVVAPKLDRSPGLINDPISQEWAEFRCHQLSSYYAEMSAWVRSINNSVAVDNNPSAGISGRNVIWEQGVDYPRLLGTVDIAFTEQGDNATVTSEGILISKIRTFKAAALLKKRIFCYTWGADSNWGYQENHGGLLQIAESMTYNRQCLGMVGDFNAVPDLPAEPREYIRFFHQNFELYREVESVCDVGLLYSFSSMGFNEDRPMTSFMLASQMLIQGRLLFDVIFDQHLESLSKYRVLFLADQECLSDRQIELVRAFVIQGGGLVATEHTSLYDERRERRRDFGLRDCFGVSAPRWLGPGSPEALLPGGPVRTQFGKGEVVYIPEIISNEKSPAPEMRRSQRVWSLATNNEVLRDAVLSAMRGDPTVQTPKLLSPYVTIELVHQHVARRLILHFLNYDHARDSPVNDLDVKVAIPGKERVKNIQLSSPDRPDEGQQLRWSDGDTVEFTVPALQIYSIVVIDLA